MLLELRNCPTYKIDASLERKLVERFIWSLFIEKSTNKVKFSIHSELVLFSARKTFGSKFKFALLSNTVTRFVYHLRRNRDWSVLTFSRKLKAVSMDPIDNTRKYLKERLQKDAVTVHGFAKERDELKNLFLRTSKEKESNSALLLAQKNGGKTTVSK